MAHFRSGIPSVGARAAVCRFSLGGELMTESAIYRGSVSWPPPAPP
ncbi:MAG: hypothetical protein ABSH49_24785 [Bryobacteraceae bacterium]